MSRSPRIKILISCHKPVCSPRSEVFLPVHVGAQGKEPLPSAQPDNEGENISDRNFTFCEMTGQYWAWKNLDADYIGQCHYRRYFCFDGERHSANDHAQIEGGCLSDFAIARYHLDDEQRIRGVVTACDLVTAPWWNVTGVPTPLGPQRCIRRHMVAYGLLEDEDLDELVRICREVQPDYADDVVEYLSGSRYLGYNCFIMRRDLFDRLCEFEFSILRHFDEGFQYEGLTTTRRRICGYLGEILYSAFVRHIKRTERIRVTEVPLVFFDQTPPRAELSLPEDRVNIVWHIGDEALALCAVGLRSLAESLGPASSYQLTLIHGSGFDMTTLRRLAGSLPNNLALVDITLPALELGTLSGRVTERELREFLPALLPWLASMKADTWSAKCLYVEGVVLFAGDPATMIGAAPGPIGALSGVRLERELNRPTNRSARALYRERARGAQPLDASVLVLDCAKLVHIADAASLLAKCRQVGEAVEDELGRLVARSELLAELGAQPLSFDVAYPVLDKADTMTWSSEETARAWGSASDETLLSFAPERNPIICLSDSHCLRFWSIARLTPAYETLLAALHANDQPSLRDRVFPVGSKRRHMMSGIRALLRRAGVVRF